MLTMARRLLGLAILLLLAALSAVAVWAVATGPAPGG
jgi:hypothetical protein